MPLTLALRTIDRIGSACPPVVEAPMAQSGSEHVQFSGSIQVKFLTFLQGLMETDQKGDQAFVGVIRGIFGSPPDGTQFDVQVKLSVGADFTDDAYEITVHPALAQLGAHPVLRRAAFDFVNGCMSMMVGPNWRRMTGLTATNNVIQRPGPLLTIEFHDGTPAW
jgi:hypothetical protein